MKEVNCEIVTIGDEILYGQTINTNASWLGITLTDIGVAVKKNVTIQDRKADIVDCLDRISDDVKLVIITGGLGPTKDDITKATLAEYFGSELKEDPSVIEDIKYIFGQRGRHMNELNKTQALIPSNCQKITNTVGTAPGMWFKENGKIYVSMPGVPREMKTMMSNEVLKRIKSTFDLPVIHHGFVKTVGIPESILAEKIETWQNSLPQNIGLAYLPSLGEVKLRLTAKGGDKKELEKEVDQYIQNVIPLIQEYVYALDESSLSETISKLLLDKGLTIATAESCTGGNVASELTSLPGSSRYFMGSVVSYDNQVKEEVLGVLNSTLLDNGAVSEEVVVQMVEGVRDLLNTDLAVATTGIAGPDGGSEEKPVGTVWIAFASKDKTITKKLQLGNMGRNTNIQRTVVAVLNLIRNNI